MHLRPSSCVSFVALSLLVLATPALAQEGSEGSPAGEATPKPPAPEPEWGVGGTEQEGRFTPQGKTGAKKREEQEKEDEAGEDPVRKRPPLGAGVDVVIGFGSFRDVRNDSNPTHTTVASFVPFFEWRISDRWAASVKLPVSTASIEGPLGTSDDYNQTALGNLDFTVQGRFKLKRRWSLPASLSIDFPTGQGDMFPKSNDIGALAQALINYAASASRGWEEQALFAPRRFSFTPAVGIQYDTHKMHAALNTKFELMIRAGGGDPATPDDGTIHSPAYNWVTRGSFFYDFLDGMVSPGLRAWLAVTKQPVSRLSSDYSGAQFVIEPDVNSRVPLAGGRFLLQTGIGYVIPVGGPIGGGHGASISGLRLKAGLDF